MKKRILSLLLVILLIRPITANAATDAQTIYVRAESLFDDTSCAVELLESDERYYISEDGVRSITRLNLEITGSNKVMSGSKIKVDIDFENVVSKDYDGKTWYVLEEAMNKVQVYILSNGDGVLYFNSPWSNLDSLLVEIDDIMAQNYFSANMLEEMGFLADTANVVANIYDIVTNFRVNALWGGAYEKDISEQIMTLLLPMVGSNNLFSDIKSANRKISKAAKTILKLENAYENIGEYLYDIPAGGDVLLFGIEGTELLRESAEAVNAVNSTDLTDLFLRARLGYAGMKEFEEALDEIKVNYLTDVHAFSLGDLISVGEYIIDTTRISSEYALALESVLERSGNTDGGLWSKYKRGVIKSESEKVLSDYKAYMTQNYLSMFGGTVSEIFASISSNMTENALEQLLMGSGSLWSDLFVTALNFCTSTDKKTDAVRTMYMLGDIQSLFKDSYTNACLEGIGPENAVFCKGIALLYLKSAWQAVSEFSFDTPIKTLETQIENSMTTVRSFPDETFTVITNETRYPVGTFNNVAESEPLAISTLYPLYGLTTYYDYIDAKIVKAITYKSDGSVWSKETYNYNSDGYLVDYYDHFVVCPLCGPEGHIDHTHYEYDLQGNLIKETIDEHSDLSVEQSYSYYYTYEYNERSQLIQKSHYTYGYKCGIGLYDLRSYDAYEYDSEGRIQRITTYYIFEDTPSFYLVDEYEYSDKGQLTRAGNLYYSYDDFGNLIEERYYTEQGEPSLHDSYYTYEYDSMGKLLRRNTCCNYSYINGSYIYSLDIIEITEITTYI